MKDKELKIEEVKTPHTLGGSSYVLSLYCEGFLIQFITTDKSKDRKGGGKVSVL